MQSIEFEGVNARFGKPVNWDDETMGECLTLPVMVCPDGRMVSVWMPTREERAILARGGGIALHILAETHPVVALAAIEVELPDSEPAAPNYRVTDFPRSAEDIHE